MNPTYPSPYAPYGYTGVLYLNYQRLPATAYVGYDRDTH